MKYKYYQIKTHKKYSIGNMVNVVRKSNLALTVWNSNTAEYLK